MEKITSVSKIEILETGEVQVRETTRILEDGALIAETHHRHVIVPGDDFGSEDEMVKKVCRMAHTPAAKKAWRQRHGG